MDYYNVLGVSQNAPEEVIRAAYRVLVQKYHPDRNQSLDASQKMLSLNEAYEVLSNPVKRRLYDQSNNKFNQQHPLQWKNSRAPINKIDCDEFGHRFTLTFASAELISYQTWDEQIITSKGGGGVTVMGYGFNTGPKVQSKTLLHQQMVFRINDQDLLLTRKGTPLPLVAGQDIELVKISGASIAKDYIIAIINRSSKTWYWVDSLPDAGSKVRSNKSMLKDFSFYLLFISLICLLATAWLMKSSGIFGWLIFVVFGIPFLLGISTPILYKTSNLLGRSIRNQITTYANKTLSF